MANTKLTKIQKKLERKNAKERATIKGSEIAKIVSVKKTKRSKYDVEVVSLNPIDGGVELFVKAWGKNGKQIGFGKDGSVDIERFRIFNPPVLVDDPQGDIVKTWEEEQPDGTFIQKQRTLREDAEEAVLQVIEHNLSVMKNVHDDKKIVKGKRGNTTSTFYPYVDARLRAGSTNDRPPQSSDWNIAHDKTDCTGLGGNFDKTSTSSTIGIAHLHSNYRMYIDRGAFFFDTSAIGSGDDIDSALFSLYVTSKRDTYNDGDDYINVVEATPASDADIVTGDFDQIGDAINNPTQGATAIDIGSITTSAYNTWTLNVTGEGWVSKTGDTTLGVREGHDIEDVYAGDGSGEDYTDITVSMSEETGTTQDPKLVVEHSASSVDVTANAGVVSATVSTPAPAISGGANVSQGTPPSASFSTPAPAISGGAIVASSVVTATFSLPAPNIITPDSFVEVSVVTASFSLPAPTVEIDTQVDVGVLTATFSQPASSVAIDFTHSAGVQDLSFSLPAPTIIEESNITVTPDAQVLTFSLPSPTVTAEINGLVEAGVLTATFSLPAPTITAVRNVSVSVNPVTAIFSVNSPTKVGGLWTAQGRTLGTWTPQPRAI